MTTFALGDEDPALTEAQVFKTEPERLVAAEPPEQHGFDDGSVTVCAQRGEQGGRLGGIQNARQSPHASHQRRASQLAAVAPRRQTPRHRVDHDRRVARVSR